MIAIYVGLIHKGAFSLDKVPPGSRDKVKEALDLLELNAEGNIE